jgi:hypothetical protein
MFFYHCLSETKSQVLVIELVNDYRVSYHYSEQEGKEVESFYQSNLFHYLFLTNEITLKVESSLL